MLWASKRQRTKWTTLGKVRPKRCAHKRSLPNWTRRSGGDAPATRYIDEDGAPVYEPTAPEDAHWARGTLDVGLVTETEAVVAVTCSFGAYQGYYALVHIRGDRATLLRAPATSETGQPMDASDATFSTPSWDRLSDRILTTFGLARGLGDCGIYATYALASGDAMELSEVRQRECGADTPDDLPPPEAWPVVYTAD